MKEREKNTAKGREESGSIKCSEEFSESSFRAEVGWDPESNGCSDSSNISLN